jgi:phospholipid/cholesterol/gamma-HCH transport system substrate-binding protein
MLGPAANDPIEAGGYVESESSPSVSSLTDRAPLLIGKLETVLDGAGATFEQVQVLLRNAEPELTQTLQSVRVASQTLDATVQAQQARLTTTMQNLESFSADLNAFTTENRDSLQLLVSSMNRSFERLNTNLESLESASLSLNRILEGVESGEGTAGRILTDPELYVKLDSALTALNRLIADFQSDPGRYLEEMRLIDVF